MVRRGWWALGAAVSVLAFASAAAAAPNQDPLVAVLVEKGVISQADAAGVTTRDDLVKLLQAKGILNQGDVNSIAQAEPQMLAGEGAPPNEAPVYFHEDHPTTLSLGNVDLTVGGFVDVQTAWRTTNTGNPGGLNFFAIPFSNTVGGNISEARINAANSRLSLKADTHFQWAGEPVHAVGYFEGDFLGNDAANVFVTSNSHTFRVRQFFVDAQRGQWEILAGQAWSWVTPNRVGLASYPEAIFNTNDYDPNYNVGLTWTRATQLRVAYHANQNFAVGLGLENPQQFVGAGEVIFPFAFNAQLGVQFDAANNSGAPNRFPDIVAKAAYDNKTEAGLPFHIEAVGIVRQFHIVAFGAGLQRTSATGWAAEVNGNVQVMPSLTLLGDAFYGEGGGRYVFGMGPDVVVLPVDTAGGGHEVRLSLVRSASLLGGVEWQHDAWKVSSYYGWTFFDRNFALDTTNPLPGRFAGFGGPNSPNSANKDVSEFTIEPQYVIWSSPTGGVLSTGLQASYVMRHPWFHAAGAPTEANVGEFIFDVRYTLP
jgi:hypothetical protein